MNRKIGAAMAALLLTAGEAMADNPTTFDRAAWAAPAGKPDQSGPRYDMIAAAAAEVPPGAAQADVLSRLGEPDERFDKAWAYVAGGTIFGGEYRALLVSFDDGGKVVSAREVSTETWQ